jgi:hypothetical protein
MSNTTAYKNKFISENYDRINLTVPKGSKATLQAHVSKTNESVNSFINRAIWETMERDEQRENKSGE